MWRAATVGGFETVTERADRRRRILERLDQAEVV
jgi:hypothetical protein